MKHSIIKSYCKKVNLAQSIARPLAERKSVCKLSLSDFDYITGRFRGLVTLLMFVSVSSFAQDKAQCSGTTVKQARCKRMINPSAPAHAVKSKDKWYCAQHAKQAVNR